MSKVYEYFSQFEDKLCGPQHPDEMNIEGHIRCKCGQLWGMHNHNRYHKRCKTNVIARGKVGSGK